MLNKIDKIKGIEIMIIFWIARYLNWNASADMQYLFRRISNNCYEHKLFSIYPAIAATKTGNRQIFP